jgi:hypothetical protein
MNRVEMKECIKEVEIRGGSMEHLGSVRRKGKALSEMNESTVEAPTSGIAESSTRRKGKMLNYTQNVYPTRECLSFMRRKAKILNKMRNINLTIKVFDVYKTLKNEYHPVFNIQDIRIILNNMRCAYM